MVNDDTPRDHAEQLAAAAPDAFGLGGQLDELGFYVKRRITEGPAMNHWLAIEPMTFNRARIGISALKQGLEGPIAAAGAFAHGYADVWEFSSVELAIEAYNNWNGVGEPKGWSRHPATGRRRQADGSVLVRDRELPDGLIVELRRSVAKGAGHECAEWWGETTGRCVLCDAARPPAASIDTGDRELTGTEASDALRSFMLRGRKAQAAVDETLESLKTVRSQENGGDRG